MSHRCLVHPFVCWPWLIHLQRITAFFARLDGTSSEALTKATPTRGAKFALSACTPDSRIAQHQSLPGVSHGSVCRRRTRNCLSASPTGRCVGDVAGGPRRRRRHELAAHGGTRSSLTVASFLPPALVPLPPLDLVSPPPSKLLLTTARGHALPRRALPPAVRPAERQAAAHAEAARGGKRPWRAASPLLVPRRHQVPASGGGPRCPRRCADYRVRITAPPASSAASASN